MAAHLPSIILFSSREVLEEIGGFPYFGPSYREAVCSEIAISRCVAWRGYRFSKVMDSPFAMIGHPQWTANGKIRGTGFALPLRESLWQARGRIKRTLGLRRRVPPTRFERPSAVSMPPGP